MKEIQIDNTKIKVVYPNQDLKDKEEKLTYLYDLCNELFINNTECFEKKEDADTSPNKTFN